MEADPIFDLALTKAYSGYVDVDTSGTITEGDEVEFEITVYNQGDVDATDVEVTDYLPTGMSFVSSADFASTAPHTAMITSIPAGTEATLSIVLSIDT